MPRIDSVDLFYLKMPEIEDVGDGSQDALLVRVRCGDETGWGECEAAPLVSIAALVCPMSHGACHPVQDSVLGERLDDVADIARIGDRVRARSLDLLQADHTLSGIDMALWDLLGRRLGEPVWRLLGYRRAFAKLPYASQLFAATPAETFAKGRRVRAQGYRAAKFGWGPFGVGSPAADRDQLVAAREGLGEDGILLVDVGTVWVEDVDRARAALPALRECRALWLEEPFVSGALDAYRALAAEAGALRLAGGEGAHDFWGAKTMIDHAAIGYVQIDAGRIGGISVAKRVADYAAAQGVTYVNHTFTSHLALAASLQPFAGLERHEICEYPVEARAVAMAITRERLAPAEDGLLHIAQAPGLGVTIDTEAVRPYLQEVEITVGGRVLYRTPAL